MSTWYTLKQHIKKLHNEEIIRNQFCNVKKYYIIREINSKQKLKLCNVIILAPFKGMCFLEGFLEGACEAFQ